ncbi:ATP synthase B subunit (AtpF) [Psychromonas ingrahamii 37]|uniref:ATP synthase B subunit (AtpF) n=1 Tax=Psychromonas ingrahamii (strain DSM 17664 / CCUG 51855 / 37) TaxID=357804 RepID=A1SVL8_PSYIN|nr:hypothetical protein [Psychromonas ingrahamii]ABM03533.1 ATP synthase B subunit (AtpF) [Psychromonas ingrahamii 37]
MNFLEKRDRPQNEYIGRLEPEVAALLGDFHQMRMATGNHSAAERVERVNTNAKAIKKMLKEFNQRRININQRRIETASQDTQQRLTFSSNMTQKVRDLLDQFYTSQQQMAEISAAKRAELIDTNAKAIEEMLKSFNQKRINVNQIRIETASQDTQQRLTFASNMTQKVRDLLDQFYASRQQMAEISTAKRAELVSANTKAIEEMLKEFNKTRININQIRIEMASQDTQQRLTFASDMTQKVRDLLDQFYTSRQQMAEISAAERAELVSANTKAIKKMLKEFKKTLINVNQTRIKTASQDTQQRLIFANNMTQKVRDLLDQFYTSRQHMAEISAAERAELVSANAKAIEEMLKEFRQTLINNQTRIEIASQDTQERLILAGNMMEEVVAPKIKAGLLKAETVTSETTIDDQVKKPVANNNQSEAKTTLNSNTKKTRKARKSRKYSANGDHE